MFKMILAKETGKFEAIPAVLYMYDGQSEKVIKFVRLGLFNNNSNQSSSNL